jgi:D-amino-acid dehydrogenase
VHDREPSALPDVIGGVHFTSDASLDPARFLRGLADCARRLGADLREHTPVTGYEVVGDRIMRVLTTAEDFEPAQVVLAAGAWSPQAARGLGLSLPVQPARGYSLTARAPSAMPRQALLLGERRVAVTPMGERLRVTGRLELSALDTTPSPRHIAGIERAVREYITLDEPLTVLETWAGLRPTTPDGVPIIGFSPRHANLIIATGHAMLGLSLGPGTGQLVAELANGREPAIDLDRLNADWSTRR